MIDNEQREKKAREKERTRQRMRVVVDQENYEYIPAKKQTDYYDNDVHQRVAIYVRVSTDDVRQTTSFELQKKYYEDFVVRHPNWTLVKIYADEGISGTSLAHRDEFNKMIADCKSGKIDLIITKSVSRFARNVMICIGMVRELAELKPPVGVFFESECIFSLNEDSQMALSFQATMAEEESHIRSRSMETSLRMRLDNGIPLTPKLLGYTHDADGNLIVNKEEAPTVKLAFYMYLYGYSTQQIADAFIALGRKSYLGNIKWSSNSIIQILRNERHCGDVLTRKTFTPNFRDHKSRKNRGEKPQSRYYNHHEGIITRDDFIAVQRMLDNAKYKNKAFLPELRVINSGVLRGFVIVNTRWAGFKVDDYRKASASVYDAIETTEDNPREVSIEVEAGDFDLRGFEIARAELFDSHSIPSVSFYNKRMKFSASVVRKLGVKNNIELLVNPTEKKFALRTCPETNRHKVVCSLRVAGGVAPREICASAFYDTLMELFGWSSDCKYRISGTLYEEGEDVAYVFDASNSETFFKAYMVPSQVEENGGTAALQPLTASKNHIRAVPISWTSTFGKQYYLHERTYADLASQNERDWKLRMEGQLVDTGKKLNVTSFEELRAYIIKELRGVAPQEVTNE